MRKSVEKNDHLDHSRNLSLSPLMHAVLSAFRPARQAQAKTAQARLPLAVSSQPAIRFEALEPRVLLSGDVNPSALSINGAISVTGEQDQYEFSVEESRRVVFDSLTNRSDLNWKLEGPNGQLTSRSFTNTDYQADSPAFELTPGKYKVTVDGDTDAVGDYSLRIVDADAAADLTPGTEVSGTLDGGNKSAVYRFQAKAGDKFFFDALTAGGSAGWRLIDLYGRQEGSYGYLGNDRDTFTLQRTGEYLMVVEGYVGNTAALNYSFNLRPVTDSTEALALGAAATANIDQPGKTSNFTFSLDKPQVVLFDRLTNSGFYWSLSGPEGVVVSRTYASYGASNYTGGYGRLLLPAGDYTLSVDTSGATTGAFPFRLLADADTEALETGVAASAVLDNARGTKLYKVALNEGDNIFVDGRSLTGGALSWTLVNPYGVQLASSALLTAQAPLTVGASGDYWLVVEGSDGNAADATVSYQLAINKVPDVTATLTLGSQVSGSVDLAGQATVYSFELAGATQVAFDAQSNRSDMLWSLIGPRGTEISGRRFDQSDAGSALSVLGLPAGSYRLVVQGSGRASGGYAFQLVDLAAAQTLALDTALSGTLTPGNAVQTYRFNVAAGDMLAFQTNSVAGGNASWRLVDAYGRDVAGTNNLASNRAAFALTTGGVYTLLVEGRLDNAAPVDFDIQFNAAGHQAPTPLPAGDDLTFGTAVAGTLATWDATKTYRFTLAADTLVVMDTQSLNSSGAQWSLFGPRGTEVSLQYLYSSDANNRYPVFSLPAGSYALTVQGARNSSGFSNAGTYAFRLLDAANFSALTLGQQVSVTRSPNNATLGYRFEASAGSTMVLNWSDSYSGSVWTLVDPYGRKVQSISGDNPGSSYAILLPGTYTLLNEGYYNNSGTNNVTFTLSQKSLTVAPLVFNDQASGTLSGRQAIARYDFTQNEISPVIFDALNTSAANVDNLQWLLRGPRGDVSGWNSFSSYSNGNALGKLPPGKYSLLVRNISDTSTDYSFRMLDRDAALSLVPGVAVNETIPVGESRVYRFNANAGDNYYFDGQNSSNYSYVNGGYHYGYAYWSLLDPFGRQVSAGNTYNDNSNIPLTTSGEYLLVVSPIDSVAATNVRFNLLAKTTVSEALVLDQDMAGSIATPSQAGKYGFTLAAPKRIMVDAWDGSGFYWSLSGPRGSEASGNSFGSTPRYFNLPTGNYEFTVNANDPRTGSFHFRLSDLASIQIMALDSETLLSNVASDRSQTYRRIDLRETTELLFDAIGSSNPYASWALYDTRGQVRSSGNVRYDGSRFTLAAGSYYLVVYASGTAAAEYNLALRRSTVKSEALMTGSLVSGSVLPAQENRYSFEVSNPTSLLFESQTSGTDLLWELSGPPGVVRSGTSFSSTGVLTQISSAGTYTLRVFSQSNAASSFAFRLLDLHAVTPQALPGSVSLVLTPEKRTQVFAFDSAAGDYLSYQMTSLSTGATLYMRLVDASGNVLDSMNAAYGYSRQLSNPGRYYLLIQAGPAMLETANLACKLLLTQNHEFPLTVDAASEASLDSGQTSDTWTFTLDAGKRLLLDGLASSRVNWVLQDAFGNSLNRSGNLSDLTLLNLSAGSYRLKVTGNTGTYSMPGSYGFRLFDTAGATNLVEGVAATGSLATHAAAVFRLAGQPGQMLNLASELTGGQGRVTLFDIAGNYVWSGYAGGDTRFTVGGQAGDYLLVVDSELATTDSVSYNVLVSKPQEQLADASIGDVLIGHLAASYEFHSYRIDLTAEQRLLIADTGTDGGLSWRIVPAGMGLQQGGWRSGSNFEHLGAGSYVLTVSSSNHAGGDYRVQLRDPLAAMPLSEAGLAGQLADGRNAAIYAFDTASVQRLTVNLATADPAQLRWALYSDGYYPLLNVSSGVARDTEELSAGRYFLVVYGMGAATDIVDYAINVAPIVPSVLTLGESVSGRFPLSGDQVDYTFSLTEKTTVLFDALQGASSGIFYSLYNESGSQIASSMFYDNNIMPRALEAGDYRLRIQRYSTLNGKAVADPFAFRLASMPQLQQGMIEYGVPVSGTLADGTQTVAYQIDMQAGDWVSFTQDSVSVGSLNWRMLDANGNDFLSARSGNRSNIHITSAGRYTLLLNGDLTNSAALDYQFTVGLERHVDTRPAGGPLPLGALTDIVVPASGSTSYRLHVDADTVLAVSGKTADGRSLRWQLQGVENSLGSGYFSGASGSASIYPLSAGDYALTLTETSGTGDAQVTFLVEDRAHAQNAATEGDIVTTGSHMFKATLAANETLYFRSPGQANWRIYGPNNNYDNWSGGENGGFSSFMATTAGEYLFILEQDYSALPVNAKLELRHQTDRRNALDLDTPVSGSIESYQTDSYTFTLAESRQLLLDLCSATDSFNWQLTSAGEEVAQGYWYGFAPADSWSNPLLNLSAGSYVLKVSSSWQTAAYEFRLRDLTQATALNLDSDTRISSVSGVAQVFKFGAQAGDSFVYQPGNVSVWGYWRLIGADGSVLSDSYSNDLGSTRVFYDLPATASYYLIWDSQNNGETTVFDSDFAVRVITPAVPTVIPALGQAVSGNLADDGNSRFNFHVDAESSLFVDVLNDAMVDYWEIADALGDIVASGGGSESSMLAHVYEAGDYTLTLRGPVFDGSAVAFRLIDVGASAFAGGASGEVSGVASAGQAIVARVDVLAGQSLVYEPIDLGGLTGRYLVFDANGNLQFSGDASQSYVLRWLATDTTYFLVFDTDFNADLMAAVYTFRRQSVQPEAAVPLTLGTSVADTLGADGARSYQFEITHGSLLWLDLLNSMEGRWSISNALGDEINNGWLNGSDGVLISLAAPGSYVLTLNSGERLPVDGKLAFKLLDLADSAQVINPETRVDGELNPGSSTQIYRFNALSSDRFKFVSYGSSLSGGLWRLYNRGGSLLGSGDINNSGNIINLNYYGSGQYYLVIDGSTANSAIGTYSFAASLNRVALDTVYSGTASYYSPTSYRLHLDQAAWLDFDALKAASGGYGDNYVYWTLAGANGQVFSSGLYNGSRDPAQMLAAGDYTLNVSSSYYYYSTPYQFRILSAASAEAMTPSSTTSATLTPGNSTKLYSFEGTAGDVYTFRSLQSISGYWRLIDPEGKVVFNASSSTTQDMLSLAKSGRYLLLIEGYANTFSNQAYSFVVAKAVDKGAVILNTTQGDTLAAGSVERYSLHLGQVGTLVFDNLGTNSTPTWRLVNSAGTVVFNQTMAYNYYYGSYDFKGQLAAGDYTLIIGNSSAIATPYAFRVLDLSTATAVQPGTPVSTTVMPANGAKVFTFDAVAGERYYFDALYTESELADTYLYRSIPRWTLLDPTGRALFSNAEMGFASVNSYYDNTLGRYRYRDLFYGYDQEPAALSMTGTYTIVLEGGNSETTPQANVSFNLVKVPNNPVVVLDTLLIKPAPDLTVNSLSIDPVDNLQTGQTVSLSWVVENRGVLATAGNWNDRVLVRNLDTGILIANVSVPYDAATDGNIAAGESRTRKLVLRLPDGSPAAGHLSITILADGDNAIREGNTTGTSESNNAQQIEVNVALAPYADLTVADITLDPAGNYQPGQLVNVAWTTGNSGSKAVEAPWSERLEVRNLSTNEVVASVVLRDDLADGALDVGTRRLRNAQFTWPVGASASGRFAIRIIADSLGEIAEANLAGSGESNNLGEVLRTAGPDMQIRNLKVVSTDIRAGGPVTISWEDWNLGSSATGVGFDDRIVVRNTAANLTLLDTSLAYNPLQQADGLVLGAIQPGQSRQRGFTFRLPYGLKGTGDISIAVTADQNAGGVSVLFETNLTNDAEANNTARVSATSAAVPYADLRVDSLLAQDTGVGGEPVSVSWTVSNNGGADTAADWNDQIVVSTDAVIGNADDVVIANVRHLGGLNKGGTYTQNATIRVPLRSEGRYYLGVKADTGNEVIEPDTRSDNVSAARAIDLAAAYADLNILSLTAPETTQSAENILVTWEVRNDGNATTDLALWNDRVVLSTDPNLGGSNDIVLAGSVTHAGLIAPGASYVGRATITLPRDLNGEFYVIVATDINRSITELGHTGNNTRTSIAKLRIGLAPVADLAVSEVSGPGILRPGDAATVTYTVANQGGDATATAWRDRIYIDRGASGLYEVAGIFSSTPLEAGASVQRTASFTLPSWFAEGEFRWVVRADAENTIYERDGEGNNQTDAASTVQVVRPDLAVSSVSGPGLIESGNALHVEWMVSNAGGVATGDWKDVVSLYKSGVLQKSVEVAHAGGLAAGASYGASVDLDIPLDYSGEYEIRVLSDSARIVDDRNRNDNQATAALTVGLAPYADLAVTALTAPERIIADPAPLDVSWTVSNQGTGIGRSTAWSDRVILSLDDTLGNGDDRVIGEYRHNGALAAGESYSRTESILLAPGSSARYKLFVVSDAKGEVFENASEANNVGRVAHDVDVMPIPYADLQVASVTAEGTPASGRPLRVSWEVVNNGIGLTNIADWSDSVWLSRKADGSDVVASLGSASHAGQLAVDDRYSRSLDIVLPEGIEGDYYLNVRTGGPFEFVYGNNNTESSVAIPVSLSKSPDLVVETVSLPASALEGALIDVSWTVVNQGEVAAAGLWVDSVWLVAADGSGNAVSLGSFTYDRSLESGIRYTRTEQLRLPSKIEGLYRIKVVTNANLGGNGNQVYEHGAARSNNAVVSADLAEVSMLDRPDLRVSTVTVPEHVTAGIGAAIRYTIGNMGAVATSGRWTDKVYLSLDGTLSGDDRLVGQFESGGALAPSESYANETGMVDIPIRYRGDAYLIVVADGNNNIDEYPNEANNVRAAHLYIDPVPFGDLVTSDVVAPDQAVHGSNIEVRYKVANLGSQTTRGEAAALNSWTDSVWLARDKRRPGAYKGDILLGSFTHVGNLGVGEDYLGTAQVAIPDNVLSGEYFITVWSDTYDVILEDTLATNINPDDAAQIDNNNYMARPISVLGITPPDLVVSSVVAPDAQDSGSNYTFSYTVQNRGDVFEGKWTDSVFITDNPDLNLATEVWAIGSYAQQRSLGNGESYSVTQTVQLAPSVKGRYVVVKADASLYSYRSGNRGGIGESNEDNNARALASTITARPTDLQVTEIHTEPSNDSGEETTISWTVTNFGDAVWSGTRSWTDAVYISRDPTFIRDRAIALGSVVHANVNGLAASASYVTSGKFRLPAGTDGQYYIYVIADNDDNPGDVGQRQPKTEYLRGSTNTQAFGFYSGGSTAGSVFEGLRNDNNMARGSLDIAYCEPDLQIDNIVVSEPNPYSGEALTATWTVTNRGTRDTRTNAWFDGLFLSRDASLDYSDFPLVDRGSEAEVKLRAKYVSFYENNKPKYLKPGESYTVSATFNLPESISGDFHLIVKTDTAIFVDPWGYQPSTVRDGLPGLARLIDPSGTVLEFKDEGNNVSSIALPITLATPPDLLVASVTAPERVYAGQSFTVNYRVVNQGGNTPSDQTRWNDLIYLSKDRFLDVNKDAYLGYVAHNGGLAGADSYDGSLTVTAPKNMDGPYYVFVVTDPARAWGTGEYGRVREFGREQNNASAAVQPILVEVPPPADLKVTNVSLPASANVGEEIRLDYTVANDSINTAYGRWTDALYLSSDNTWDLGDILVGKVDHLGDLGANGSYSGTLLAKLPPLKDGNWRVIVRPDLYNEVFEGKISYTATGLNLPVGEANNRTASGATLQVTVPVLPVASPLVTTLSPGQSRLYKVSVAAGETLRVSLDAAAREGSNEIYVRYGDIPTGYVFDAAYTNPVATDQEALIGSTKAGDYYVLVRSRQGSADAPVTVRADLLPLSIGKITPDQGGTGDDNHRWVTLDIYGAHFKAGALVKLSRPGIFEAEPERWQVLDATHIQAVFDLRNFPLGLYDVSVTNPDGQKVTEAQRYLVERGIEADVTIGIGGSRTLTPGENGLYSVSLQSLSNVDTPYVRFDFGAPEMGYSADVLEGLSLPYIVFGTNVAGQPAGATLDTASNTQTYGQTPTDGTSRGDIPWAKLDGAQNTAGVNLAPGYAFDVPAGGFVGMTFSVQTYPGLAEWLAYDFEGLRDKLYAVHPEWKAQGLLDGGVQDLDKISGGLTAKFLSHDPEVHVTKLENLAIPFRFNIVGAATPITAMSSSPTRRRTPRNCVSPSWPIPPHPPAWLPWQPTRISGSTVGSVRWKPRDYCVR